MAYEEIFEGADFTLFYIGAGGGGDAGGHLFQIEPTATAAQNNVLLFEAPRNVAEIAGGFVINFRAEALVYQDKGPLHNQGIFSDAGRVDVFDDNALSDEPAARLRRIQISDGFYISEKGVLWHEARVYRLDKSGDVMNFYVLGYVPAADLSRVETAAGLEPVDYFRREW